MSALAKRESRRLIRGVVAKFVDGRWHDADGLPLPARLLVVGTTRALQCWREQKPIDTIIEQPDEPLPDVNALNEQIPKNEWENGLDGKPRGPWQLNHVVYLINMETADSYTYLNSTYGASIAVEQLNDKLDLMRRMRGAHVLPIVALESRPMKTAFGPKQRPHFTIVEWRNMEPPTPAIAPPTPPSPTTPQLEKPAETSKPVETPKPIDKKPVDKKPKTKIGKPVEPVSLGEEMDDEIPF